MTYVDDDDKFEWMIFKVSPGFNEVIGYANLWLALPNAPHPGLPPCAPRAIFPPRAAGQAKESFC